jgi:hypothetical protein
MGFKATWRQQWRIKQQGVAMPSYAIVGSRSTPVSGIPQVGAICSALVVSGAPLSVGCATGVDAAVLSWALSSGAVSSVTCYAAFGPGGQGAAGAVSAVSLVSRFEAAGGVVNWWAGGGPEVPVKARLAARASACVASAQGGCVGILTSPYSKGSVRALKRAASRGIVVFAVAVGFSGECLPLLGIGQWRPCRSRSVPGGMWRWAPGQASVLR